MSRPYSLSMSSDGAARVTVPVTFRLTLAAVAAHCYPKVLGETRYDDAFDEAEVERIVRRLLTSRRAALKIAEIDLWARGAEGVTHDGEAPDHGSFLIVIEQRVLELWA